MLFDMTTDPTAKQKLLSRSTNSARCQACGYEGLLSSPIVYHDPEKDLLLTYFPPELGLPINEQEKQIGPLINQIVNALPPEKRKGYLFQPNTMFTYQTLIDRVLEADGITKEMVEAQQKRVNLLQRLLTTANAEDRATIIRQENELADGELFTILSTLIQTSAAQGDETGAKMLAQIQNELLKETDFGRKLLADSQETQAALKELDKANKEGLTREKLLDVLSSVKSESSLITLVSVTRTGLDYQFFQVLSERIEASEGDGKQSLIALRDKLLKLTREIDLEMKKRLENAVTLVESILKEEDAQAAIEKHAQEIDEFFSQAVQMEFEKAREENDLARIEKIQKLISVIEKMTAPPAEVEFLQTLLETREENERARLLDEKIELVNDQFLQTINSIIAEGESHKQSPELLEELKSIYKLALRKSMEKNLKS
jgi:hypothetical protein